MAKKYLLYIHYDQFDKEDRKSFLVNDLLGNHYGQKIAVKPRPIYKKRIEPKPSPVTVLTERFNVEVCEHGAGRGFCRNSKCKYSQFSKRNRL
jgi:hypothetical protein